MSFSLCLITGATSGIGYALAHLLAEKGIPLILSGRNEEKLKELADVLQKKVEVIVLCADLAQEEGRQTVADKMRELSPDLVINNAGFGLYGAAISYTIEQQNELLKVDGNAVLQLTLAAAKAMLNQGKQGVILNVSSAIAFQIVPYFAVYAATKAFVNHFSIALDEELKDSGIRVLTSCPGVVRTEFSSRASAGKPKWSHQTRSMSSEFAAQEIWKQIVRRKQLHIFDWRYRLLTLLSKLMPQQLRTKIAEHSMKYNRL